MKKLPNTTPAFKRSKPTRVNQPGEGGGRSRSVRPSTPAKGGKRPSPPASINKGTDSKLRKAVRNRTGL